MPRQRVFLSETQRAHGTRIRTQVGMLPKMRPEIRRSYASKRTQLARKRFVSRVYQFMFIHVRFPLKC